MKRFKNILVVIHHETSNEALIERAVTVGQRNQARLTVVVVIKKADMPLPAEPPVVAKEPSVNIIEEFPVDMAVPVTSKSPEDIQERIPNTIEELPLDVQEYIIQKEKYDLDLIVASIQQAGVQVSSEVLFGSPFLEIIREVLRGGYDLVMIAAEGRTGLKEALFGSTTMHLMRQCPCPVWVMNPTQPEHYSHILAAVDPSPSGEERDALNIKILDLATSLAHREQCELLILHTWSYPLESHVRSGRVSVPQSKLDEWVRAVRDAHKRSLGELLQLYDLENQKHQVYMLKGEAGNLIPALAAAKEIEIIVMGTVSRTGIAGLLIGNTAEKVLRQVDCSVLTVKPEGFITPVKLDA
ncbi:MAG: universal stress protein [Anaerolineales bacterium]|nr:universal stress protein [Anaerolineales bacterium]